MRNYISQNLYIYILKTMNVFETCYEGPNQKSIIYRTFSRNLGPFFLNHLPQSILSLCLKNYWIFSPNCNNSFGHNFYSCIHEAIPKYFKLFSDVLRGVRPESLKAFLQGCMFLYFARTQILYNFMHTYHIIHSERSEFKNTQRIVWK